MAVLEQSWIKVQEKTFGKWWVNALLSSALESTASKQLTFFVTAG
jgi:hypothetical protein